MCSCHRCPDRESRGCVWREFNQTGNSTRNSTGNSTGNSTNYKQRE